MYRDHFDGFLNTLRRKHNATKGEPMLHYFHDVIMERDGEPKVPRWHRVNKYNKELLRKKMNKVTICYTKTKMKTLLSKSSRVYVKLLW